MPSAVKYVPLLLLLLAAPTAIGQPVPAPLSAGDPLYQEILRLEQERIEAYARRDTAHLARDFAAEYLHTNLRGGTTTRSEELAFYGTDDFDLGDGALSDLVVRRYGDTVVMTGQISWRGARYRGVDLSGDFRVTRAYVLRDGHWQVVASHASRIGG